MSSMSASTKKRKRSPKEKVKKSKKTKKEQTIEYWKNIEVNNEKKYDNYCLHGFPNLKLKKNSIDQKVFENSCEQLFRSIRFTVLNMMREGKPKRVCGIPVGSLAPVFFDNYFSKTNGKRMVVKGTFIDDDKSKVKSDIIQYKFHVNKTGLPKIGCNDWNSKEFYDIQRKGEKDELRVKRILSVKKLTISCNCLSWLIKLSVHWTILSIFENGEVIGFKNKYQYTT
jgi:hypothetical protein